MKFEEKLVLLRKKKGLSQEQLANELDISRQAISRWELGSTLPDAPNLLKLSSLFGVSIDYLLHDEYESDNDLPKLKETHQHIKQKDNKDAKTNLIAGILWTFASICYMLSALINPNVHPLIYINIILGIALAARHMSLYRKLKERQ